MCFCFLVSFRCCWFIKHALHFFILGDMCCWCSMFSSSSALLFFNSGVLSLISIPRVSKWMISELPHGSGVCSRGEKESSPVFASGRRQRLRLIESFCLKNLRSKMASTEPLMTVYLLPCSKIKLFPYFTYFELLSSLWLWVIAVFLSRWSELKAFSFFKNLSTIWTSLKKPRIITMEKEPANQGGSSQTTVTSGKTSKMCPAVGPAVFELDSLFTEVPISRTWAGCREATG